jgi:type II secretory ATPase GspE/PulE/Tfp pilus assembly ATPase PilB-like protein
MANPFVAYFEHVLAEAWSAQASDIHIEPFGNSLTIKARIDSVLRVLKTENDPVFVSRLTEVVKRICGFDMGLAGVPQDQRFAPEGFDFDCRASLCPTMHGEKIVLRLLQRNKTFDLEAYALPEAAKRDLLAALHKWQGLIVVSGPTGSGKSTLLYSALGVIDRVANNTHTIEDPIEYALPHLNQTQTVRGKLGFADVIRALLRQDPDVILVGEVRDAETAETALHAASTGHLVLTTVHANSAAEIVDRLVVLGVSRELVIANLLFASAQRLVPRLCPACAVDDEPARDRVRATFHVDLLPKRAAGCSTCRGGVKGRVLLFEWLTREREGERYALVQRDDIAAQAAEYLRKGVIDADSACGLLA